MNDLPIRARDGGILYVRDVAHVRDGYTPQTSVVRVDGKARRADERAKNRQRIHIDIINGINKKLGPLRATLPMT